MTFDVYIVDDDPVIREELIELVSGEGYQAYGFAAGGTFLSAAGELAPGCVILDQNLPDITGIELLEQLIGARSAHHVLMLTGVGRITMAVAAMQLGAVDFIEKPCTASRLLEAIASAQARLAQEQIIRTRRSSALELLARLTPRELEVAAIVCRGFSSKEVARELCISPRTVDNHRASLTAKLDVKSLPDLLRLLVDADLCEMDLPEGVSQPFDTAAGELPDRSIMY